MDFSPLIEAAAFWINIQAYIQLFGYLAGVAFGTAIFVLFVFLFRRWFLNNYRT